MATTGLGRVLIITLCVLLLNILARVVFAKNKHG
ncbi:phosphate ABC transporter permease [Escherichia coli]|uniref:Phosphate ABC transporter permease n=1 Tax=Escherichia coli TaxID=562 RepID=A0A2X3JUN5_ECOLX|nr:phosphate ABC transporter permease [Escherichia coli]